MFWTKRWDHIYEYTDVHTMINILTIEDQEYSTLEAPYQDVINLVIPANFFVSFSGRNPD